MAHRERLLSELPAATCAIVRSASGPQAGAWLRALPTDTATALPADFFQVLLRRRLRLPLPSTWERCRCGRRTDELGDHRAACSTSGLLARRAGPLEKAWARVFREAQAHVRWKPLLGEVLLLEDPTDGRQLDFVASGLPLHAGIPLCCDSTTVAPLHQDGSPWPRAAVEDGVSLRRARADKETKYWELLGSNEAHLVVLACEVGGRWSAEATAMVRDLVAARVREAVPLLRRSAALAWHRRWWSILSCAAQRSVAATLLDQRVEAGWLGVDGPTLETSEVACGGAEALGWSCLPLRS